MATHSSPLGGEILTVEYTPATKLAILNAIWGSDISTDRLAEDSMLGDSYIGYYSNQCSYALRTKGIESMLQTHQDIVDIIDWVTNPNKTRRKIKESIRRKLENPATDTAEIILNQAVDLAARLSTMVDVGDLPRGFTPGQRPLRWEDGALTDLLKNRFNTPSNIPLRVVMVKLDRLFTARNLERIAGLQVVWTDNISDHLKLTVDDTRVSLYHHASFLEHHQLAPLFPPGFIDETLRTLALLIPSYDKKSTKWYRAKRAQFSLDARAATWGHLTTEERQIESFVYWHDRIGILKQVFDEAEPSNIAQWWRDRRRLVQWYTFWVAAVVLTLTIFFGMVQCIEGGVQVYKAYHPS